MPNNKIATVTTLDSTTLKVARALTEVLATPERELRNKLPLHKLQALELARLVAETTGKTADPAELETYFTSPRPAAKSGEHRTDSAGGLTVLGAIQRVCAGVWLTPKEIGPLVEDLRPGTKKYVPPGVKRSPYSLIYPALQDGKEAGTLLERGGRYKTA